MKTFDRVYTVHERVQAPVCERVTYVLLGSYNHLAGALRRHDKHPERLLRVTFKNYEKEWDTVSTYSMVLIGFNHRYFVKACKVADVSINTVRRSLGKQATDSRAFHSHIRGLK